MKYREISGFDATAYVSIFENGRREAHAIIITNRLCDSFGVQLESVEAAVTEVKHCVGKGMKVAFKRYFLSDPVNQAKFIENTDCCACSLIGQSPLDGAKVAMWVYLQRDADYHCVGDGIYLDSHGVLWAGDAVEGDVPNEVLTQHYLNGFDAVLQRFGGSLKDNCLRTWFFIRDIDVNYQSMVKARNCVFKHCGLSTDTHFIASTGISGVPAKFGSRLAFNAVADLRACDGQMAYLKGLSHLNPTMEYGVAFERGTAVDYADRRHVYISGTASIDACGEIVALDNVVAQTRRMLENISVLLDEGGCVWTDVASMIVYIRDIADFAVVNKYYKSSCGRSAACVGACICLSAGLAG